MDQNSINLYISRILSGSYIFLFRNKKYKLVYPNIQTKYMGEVYASECYDQNKYNDWIQEHSIVNFLIEMGVWSINGDDILSKLDKTIEDQKVQLYENFLNPPKQKQIRKSLESSKKQQARLYNTRHSLDHLTPNGYANLLKHQYILIHSIYNLKNQRIFKGVKNIDYQKLNDISNTLSENNIDISVFRKIARNDTWRNYWSANKDRLFDSATVNWTDEQRTLVVLTKMYDSAYEHPECPLDPVFEDDDMFDGWMISQRREGEKLRSQNRTEKMLSGKNLDKANEVYIMAQSKEEAQSIYSLNDNAGLNTIKERNSFLIKNNGKEIKDSDLPDVQRELQIQQNKLFMDTRKGKG